jgi:hypothetical protein
MNRRIKTKKLKNGKKKKKRDTETDGCTHEHDDGGSEHFGGRAGIFWIRADDRMKEMFVVKRKSNQNRKEQPNY